MKYTPQGKKAVTVPALKLFLQLNAPEVLKTIKSTKVRARFVAECRIHIGKEHEAGFLCPDKATRLALSIPTGHDAATVVGAIAREAAARKAAEEAAAAAALEEAAAVPEEAAAAPEEEAAVQEEAEAAAAPEEAAAAPEEAAAVPEEAAAAPEEAAAAPEEAAAAPEEAAAVPEEIAAAPEDVSEAVGTEAGADPEALTSYCWTCGRDVLAEDWGGERCSDVDACEQRRKENELSQKKRKRRSSSYAHKD